MSDLYRIILIPEGKPIILKSQMLFKGFSWEVRLSHSNHLRQEILMGSNFVIST